MDAVAGALANLQQHSCSARCLGRALVEAFERTDGELAAEGGTELCGTTAAVAMVGRHHVWIANVGARPCSVLSAGHRCCFVVVVTLLRATSRYIGPYK